MEAAKVISEARLIDGEMMTIEDILEKKGSLMGFFAKKYSIPGKRVGLDRDDIMSLIREALLTAFDEYQPEAGFKFSTIWGISVRNKVFLEIRKNEKLYMPHHAYVMAIEVKSSLDENVTVEKLVSKHKCAPRTAKAVLRHVRAHYDSLDEPIAGSEGLTVENLLSTDDDESSIIVRDFLSHLSGELLLILNYRYQGKTYREIGVIINKSRSYVYEKVKELKELWLEYEQEEVTQ
ncbi:hypothetical protein BTO30_14970 [Domibacillus antri]|uniref:RNA polymerase sigma-70 region 2 domain-containing protein n=1 Tax=Domibacillus antri TaxID=1714264 RepID=A0A1Q8Q272_9BACI|nr:hypothetical protein [Domibacillus antri]OLN21417.1 hypothetical protein BTO30_14970 [Domibacillus antri]